MKFGIVMVVVGILTLVGVDHFAPNPVMAAVANANKDLDGELVFRNRITGAVSLTPKGVSDLTVGGIVAIVSGLVVMLGMALLPRKGEPAKD